MEEWYNMLEPSLLSEDFFKNLSKKTLGHNIIRSQNSINPDINNAKIAIIGVPEDRDACENFGSANAPNKIREQLFKLMLHDEETVIADIGNIKKGDKVKDTYVAVSIIISELLKKNIFPIILGGSNDIAYANYLAYEKLEQIINIASIDSRFDIAPIEAEMNSQTYLSQIILRQPNFLFNYTNIGYQSYFVDKDMLGLMNQLFFDTYRVGAIRSNIEEAEPLLRNVDMLSVDVSAIRQSDAPANEHASPNGFYGEEICQICRYAGMSDKLTSAGFYELNTILDNKEQTAKLFAQMIWFIIDGISKRKSDNPKLDPENNMKYHVFNHKINQELLFYKSKKSGRWWMEVPFNINNNEGYKRHYLVACSYKDYQDALKNEIPDRWWQTYQKIL